MYASGQGFCMKFTTPRKLLICFVSGIRRIERLYCKKNIFLYFLIIKLFVYWISEFFDSSPSIRQLIQKLSFLEHNGKVEILDFATSVLSKEISKAHYYLELSLL